MDGATTEVTVVVEAGAQGDEDAVVEEVEGAVVVVVVALERLDMHPTATAAGTCDT